MAYQWGDHPNNLSPPVAVPGYSGPVYYQRSAPSSPYGGVGILHPSPGGGGISPLPGPVWLPYYSPNSGQPIALPPTPGGSQPAQPVLIDILLPGKGRSSKGPTISYDVRDYFENASVNTRPPKKLTDAHLNATLTSPPTYRMKVISKAFPWEIDVDSGDPSVAISVGDLLNAIHDTLQKHIKENEWWIVSEDTRTKVSAQYVKNCDHSGSGDSRHRGEYEKERSKKEGLRRVDWLHDNVIMHGLERDEAYSALRVRDKETRDLTWLLVVGPK